MAQLQRYDGRRVLITGGGSGIGQASVLRILDEGGSVVAADISEAGLQDTLAKAPDAGNRLGTVVMDVGNEESVRRGVTDAVQRLGASTPWSMQRVCCGQRISSRRHWPNSNRCCGSISWAHSS